MTGLQIQLERLWASRTAIPDAERGGCTSSIRNRCFPCKEDLSRRKCPADVLRSLQVRWIAAVLGACGALGMGMGLLLFLVGLSPASCGVLYLSSLALYTSSRVVLLAS